MDQLDLTEVYKQPPPHFGHAMFKYFALDPSYVNLNHGSYGSVPLPVLSAASAMAYRIEANPDQFHRLEYQPLLVAVRQRIAQLIGADPAECVLVTNASLGINTILRNFEWDKEDTIVIFNTTYASVSSTSQNINDVSPHPSVSMFTIQFPTTHAEIISRFRENIRSIPKIDGKKIVAVIDSIMSNPGVLMPWKEMVEICREEGVWSVIDAAHSIGQEVDIDLSKAKPDFWVSNCHKWLYAKRSCAVLYVPTRNQHIIKTALPTSYMYGFPGDKPDTRFVDQFEWHGTIDFVPYLTVGTALDFRNWLGGEAKINAYCHELAVKGGKRLAEVCGTRVLDPNGELTLNMVNVELPFPAHIQPTYEIGLKFQEKMLLERKAYSAHFYHNGRWWTRCSAQIWHEIEDFEKLGEMWLAVCKEVLEELEEGET